ncbi:hypothetical protein AVEN_4227-1 [Araneus ventricosus]|uniref:Uncharacterized protein n=1 Tax=Araneus ventricosus TaxID=182803 RepID=A0A4Y2RYT7_ARAVE|nr:hypothetical protein AVEN_4227-1 [Araneus ventricosus]
MEPARHSCVHVFVCGRVMTGQEFLQVQEQVEVGRSKIGTIGWSNTTVLQNALPHLLHKAVIDQGWPAAALFVMGILSTFGKISTPTTYHLLAHHIWSIH